MDTRKLLAEAIGTFILVGVGSLSIVSAGAAEVRGCSSRRSASAWDSSPPSS